MFNYIKRKNEQLFSSFENKKFTKVQNYIPTYNNFFVLNSTNYNAISIKQKWMLKQLISFDDTLKTYIGTVENIENGKTKDVEIFIKEAPLLDPIKYMTGRYKSLGENIKKLPHIDSEKNCNINKRVLNPMNSSYIDNLFNIINNQLAEKGFIHGVECYGSFLAIKQDFICNIYEDLDYLIHSNYFKKNMGILFTAPPELFTEHKPKITFLNEPTEGVVFDDVETIDFHEDIDSPPELVNIDDTTNDIELIDETISTNTNNSRNSYGTSSSYSSRTSYTAEGILTDEENSNYDSESEEDEDGEDEEDGENNTQEMETNSDNESDGSFEDDEFIPATIPEYPIQMICMEQCVDTLDSLMANEELNEKELFSCMMQVIMILITYQKLFQFTHNDLHTNNVMFVETKKKYILYTYESKQYLVPTYGKIYKIIDFGRSIYTYDGRLFISDSFDKGEDAYSQYNFGPFISDKKPVVEPNYSFDLCRLACSIFDYYIDNMKELKNYPQLTPFKQLIIRLCEDDKGMNVLYKKNHEERYPFFKLYKMISRKVHRHNPDVVLENENFQKYVTTTSKLPLKKEYLVQNIDELLTQFKST